MATLLGLNKLPIKTSQELRMLSSVTINCQVTKIVINPGSQLSDIVISVANVTTSQYHNNHNIAISQVPIIAPLGCSLMEETNSQEVLSTQIF